MGFAGIALVAIALLASSVKCKMPELCGGVRYSATGGLLDSGTWNNDTGCQWILKTDTNKGITINFTHFDLYNYNFHDCTSEWIDIRGGSDEYGPWVDDKLPGRESRCYLDSGNTLVTNHNTVIVTYVRPLHQSHFSQSGSITATWTTSRMNCSPKISFTATSWPWGDDPSEHGGGLYSLVTGVEYQGYPVYQSDEKIPYDQRKYHMVNCPMYNKWIITDDQYASFLICPPIRIDEGIGRVESKDGGVYCPEDVSGEWLYRSDRGHEEEHGRKYIDSAKVESFDCASLNPTEQEQNKCVCSDGPPPPPEGATSNWEDALNSTKLIGTMVTYECSPGNEQTSVCDPASKTWIPANIICQSTTKPPKGKGKGKKPPKGKGKGKGKKRPKGKGKGKKPKPSKG